MAYWNVRKTSNIHKIQNFQFTTYKIIIGDSFYVYNEIPYCEFYHDYIFKYASLSKETYVNIFSSFSIKIH